MKLHKFPYLSYVYGQWAGYYYDGSSDENVCDFERVRLIDTMSHEAWDKGNER